MSKKNLNIQELYEISLKNGEKICKKTISEIREAMKKAAQKGDFALSFFLDQERLMYISHWANEENIIFQIEQDTILIDNKELNLCIITWGHAPQVSKEEGNLANGNLGFH